MRSIYFASLLALHHLFLSFSLIMPILDTPTKVFSSEIGEIFQNTYFEEHMGTATSGFYRPSKINIKVPSR